MDRRSEITKYITREQIGIEIGPWFSPLAPKREGYNCWSVDVFDRDTLRQRAKDDPYVADEKIEDIEEVDLLGPATKLVDLVAQTGRLGTFDYILSSHNFEHLPNPIGFLQACSKVLRLGGVLSMAVPDHRTCFDYFRPITTLAAWLDAYFVPRDRPSLAQLFDQMTSDARCQHGEEVVATFSLDEDPANIFPLQTLEGVFDFWKACIANPEKDYRDTHCSVFTPASFELLVSDMCYLELANLELLEVTGTLGAEFYVHLRNLGEEGPRTKLAHDEFHARRKLILQRVMNEVGANSIATYQLKSDLKMAQATIEELRSEHGELRRSIDVFSQQVAALQQELDRAKMRSAQLEGQEAVLREVLASRSWRMTAPMRSTAALLRDLVQQMSSRRR